MKTIIKTLVGTVAAGAMAVSATPAAAQDRHRDNGIDAGDVVAGALIIGGIAAVAAAVDNNRDRDRYRDRDYRDYRDYRQGDYRGEGWYDYNYGRGGSRYANADRAVEQCVRAAERQAERWGGGRADVTQIRDVDRERHGFQVRGRINVRNGYHDRNWNDRGWNDRRDYRYSRGDSGSFTCDYRRGRVVDIDFSGLRNL